MYAATHMKIISFYNAFIKEALVEVVGGIVLRAKAVNEFFAILSRALLHQALKLLVTFYHFGAI